MISLQSVWRASRLTVLLGGVMLLAGAVHAEPVKVRYGEGIVHGFLALHTLEGKELANGEVIQSIEGDRVSSQLVFHFKDGSVYDQHTVFSQHREFRLLNYHLVMKGPIFPIPMDVMVDADSGRMSVRYTEDGKEKFATKNFDPQPDLANGMMPILLRNTVGDAGAIMASMAVATPKPRLVTLVVTPEGSDPFSFGSFKHKALRYRVQAKIGGLAGLLAPLVCKQPPDTYVWVLGGDAPAFLRSEGPMFPGGPIWRIDLSNPEWH